MQGIMVEGVDPNNFMRFEFYSDGTDTFLYVRSFQGTASHTYVNKKIGVAGVSPLYLRVFPKWRSLDYGVFHWRFNLVRLRQFSLT